MSFKSRRHDRFSGGSLLYKFLRLNAVCSALAALALASIAANETQSAVPGRYDDRSTSQIGAPERGSAKSEAFSAISGSPWPGVIDHLLQSPMDQYGSGSAGIHINYPSFGRRDIDGDIRSWVENIAAAFQTHLDRDVLSMPPVPDSPDDAIERFLQDDDLNSEEAARSLAADNNFELWGSYSISRPSDAAVSITYELWNYTNGGAGNLDIITLNYNLLNGQRLNFVDIFEKPDLALELMSAWSREKLSGRLGEASRGSMLNTGTEPFQDNFSSITLTPEGLRINFQPWQVASWEAGVQKVDMPLEELMAAEPLLALWGRADKAEDKM